VTSAHRSPARNAAAVDSTHRAGQSGEPATRRRDWIYPAASPACLAVLREEVAAYAVGHGSSRADDLRLALTEACANVVVHAYPAAPGPLRVRATIGGRRTVLEVSDEGVGVHDRDPTAGAGFGLPIMQALTSELSVQTDVRGTHVILVFDETLG
jgi:anti-sigma regulatory factor (Ser/Thr protein kinase)